MHNEHRKYNTKTRRLVWAAEGKPNVYRTSSPVSFYLLRTSPPNDRPVEPRPATCSHSNSPGGSCGNFLRSRPRKLKTRQCFLPSAQAMCNHVPPASRGKGGRFASPERPETSAPRYHPGIWRGVGEGFLKALLDAEGASVWSRLSQSKFRSLERVSDGNRRAV